ncbi:MAG: FecR domain-containing protein [Tannerella sp.]|jgi:ferric-dicitrate binding protein FerR (iron transport regulator)|nr:FecR domain-containing protein [Tannerella sp.]
MKKEVLYRFFEGNCTGEETREVRAWVESSPENKKEFFREGKMYDAIDLLADDRQLSVPAAPAARKSLWPDLLKIASTAAIVLLMVGLWNYLGGEAGNNAMNTVNVPAGKNVNIVLPDGSSVWLNARTKMEYPSSFEKGKREIRLDGEAYFEVSYDKKRPFIVRTKDYDVEVLGTKFNLQAYSFLDRTVTSLMEGSVKLSLSTEKSNTLSLKPHQLAYFENGGYVIKPIEDYNPYRWKEGLICFDNISFPEIMKEFERYYEVRIFIENETVMNYLCTGKFRLSDGVDYALRILQKNVLFNYEREENSPVIYIK